MSPSNSKPKNISPSLINFVTFPVFALAWHASSTDSSSSSSSIPNQDGSTTSSSYSVVAYAGGGGSAKTGVQNLIHVEITTTTTRAVQDSYPIHDPEEWKQVQKRCIRIDTGEHIAVAVSILRQPPLPLPSPNQPVQEQVQVQPRQEDFIWVAVGVGDEIRLYSIPLFASAEKDGMENSEYALLASVHLPSSTAGVNTIAFHKSGQFLVVGCENGMVSICQIKTLPMHLLPNNMHPSHIQMAKIVDLQGHTKAVCNVRFHPQSDAIVLSSAKDGTCRVWDIYLQSCLNVLTCTTEDPMQANTKTKENRNATKNQKPGQILVRGCAFGDVEGRIIYTIQSGRKGNAFLSIWILKLIHSTPPQEPMPQQHEQQQEENLQTPIKTNTQKAPMPQIIFEEVEKIVISQYPVSAVDISFDYSVLTFGDTNGTVSIFSTMTRKVLKRWESIHDLPITCIAARPYPLSLPGEDLMGIRVDVMSASADNKLTALTLQRKSNMKPSRRVKTKTTEKERKGSDHWMLRFILFVALLSMAVKVSYDTCEDEIRSQNLEKALDCVLHDVWWARKDRAGISFVPH